MKKSLLAGISICASLMMGCAEQPHKQEVKKAVAAPKVNHLVDYTDFTLTSDLSHMSGNQKIMIKKMIEVAEIMDNLFWKQAYGNKDSFIESLPNDELKRYAAVNYGPWDRLQDNKPFVDNTPEKPLGANFYPQDMTKEEFDNLKDDAKTSLYTVIRRDPRGELKVIPYSKEFEAELDRASSLLMECAQLAKDPGLKKYLELRAKAFVSNDYFTSDLAWMDMKSNPIDFVVGPIENYEDMLFGYKASFEAYVLIKDMKWSKKLEKYASFLPELQKGLPVDKKYKDEMPGTDSQLNAYDVVYYAGDCNAGGKTIAINLPNDERVQDQKGSRRLQLKNAMRAKFDKILVPISEVLIDPSQRKHITFDAFFANTMFHEVAHGLGIKETINGKGTVRKALKEHASALEEGKADILGLYMVSQLHKKGEIDGDMKDYYTTFLAGIFRSVRFGAASAHGVANMVRFNFFKEYGAFEQDAAGLYKVNYEKMEEAMNALSAKILELQGNGDYKGVTELVKSHGKISFELQKDLDKIDDANIPTDVVFNQGVEVLGL
ncbi:dipeptidyl-peptidase 3 family protein [Flammeovirga aprica]|uniref:Zn-dependent hydrolase n=1 Tax=Flammeovirga aprica JL-4 TaxID=694437 RepID=A0A7X9P352_9BACT|nr:Zn-dependent hydrolase [Flammeovirga aprica]NME68137.1 Zn-dependent hydrolase [Flammeovirga aprica JL-4]